MSDQTTRGRNALSDSENPLSCFSAAFYRGYADLSKLGRWKVSQEGHAWMNEISLLDAVAGNYADMLPLGLRELRCRRKLLEQKLGLRHV